jgi:SAM-dependent methyltransferase
MNPYKFPWIMERIEREAAVLEGKHLLEVGCGMGYDSLEFLKRGVRVTATDLTPNAVSLTRRHFEIEGVQAEEVRTANALDLPLRTTPLMRSGPTACCTRPATRRGPSARRAACSSRVAGDHLPLLPQAIVDVPAAPLGRENIEHKEEDPPVNEFLTEQEILAMFEGFEILEAVQEHYRALPVRRSGLKAALYTYGFKPVYNLIPEPIARRFAYKYSVTAVKV